MYAGEGEVKTRGRRILTNPNFVLVEGVTLRGRERGGLKMGEI